MIITKLIHACLDIKTDTGRIIIDPGAFSDPLKDYSGVNAVVVTHAHQDHLDESKIHKLAEQNPSLVIFCPQEVADKLSEEMRITVPEVGVEYTVEATKLEFFGGLHAVMIDDMPQDQNFGVLVDDALYYPGDSFTPCPKPHSVLAAPTAGPWLNFKEAAAFIKQDSAKQLFGTHNAVVIEPINDMADGIFGGVAAEAGKTYHALKPGDSLKI